MYNPLILHIANTARLEHRFLLHFPFGIIIAFIYSVFFYSYQRQNKNEFILAKT